MGMGMGMGIRRPHLHPQRVPYTGQAEWRFSGKTNQILASFFGFETIVRR